MNKNLNPLNWTKKQQIIGGAVAIVLIGGFTTGIVNHANHQAKERKIEALKNKKIKKLVKYTNILREKTFGKSKFDFKISNDLGAKNDVDIFAYNCIVTEDGIEINQPVEIIL